MSCRTTPAGSAFTTYARLANGGVLSDVATLSTFHYLRSRYLARPEAARGTYTEEEYQALLQRQIDRTARSRGLDDARRESILGRLRAAQSAGMPDQGTAYALFNLNPTVRDRGTALSRFIQSMASEMSISFDDAQTMYRGYENGIDRTRGAATPDTVTEAATTQAQEMGIPTETGSVHAMVMMRQTSQTRAIAAAHAAEQRIVRTAIAQPVHYEGVRIHEWGYDARNGRLELLLTDPHTSEPTLHTYQGITADQAQDWLIDEGSTLEPRSQRIARFWFHNVRGNSAYEYANAVEAARSGMAPRCPICGQFANSLHSCPPIGEPRRLSLNTTNSRWSRQQAPLRTFNRDGEESATPYALSLPAIREFREAWAGGPVSLQISEYINGYDESGDWTWNSLRGDMLIYRDPDGNMAFNTANLNCNCTAFRESQQCRHIDAATAAARLRLNPPARVPAARLTPEQRAERLAAAQLVADQAARTDWTRAEDTLTDAARHWRNDQEISYMQDTEAFERVYGQTLDARAAADNAITVPYLRDNVLDGMAQRGSGQAFGMEIEYEFPPSMNRVDVRAAQEAIGRELYAAGLASSRNQDGYGASKRRGFRDTHSAPDGTSNWSWERDGSVNGGELVSPGLYDEPETWDKLDIAVEILRRNGAISSKRAGAHVHVGTSMYAGDPKKYAELARLMTQHEDVLFRLAADPNRGTHRNSSYSSPLSDVPTDGFADVSAARRWQGGRTRVLNYGAISDPATGGDSGSDHPEFRIFDSSLHAGTMQTQVKLAVAMTHAAARIADEGGSVRAKERVGSHAERLKALGTGRRRLTGDALAEDTATFRSFLDTLFARTVDKDQVTSLFAHTKWLNPRR